MKKIQIKDLKEHLNEEIELQAFVDNIRNLQYVQFIEKPLITDILERKT